jgi:hypothetical protein
MRAKWALAILSAGSVVAGARVAMSQTAPPLNRPTFDASKRDLLAFARATEAYCGFKPGAALGVRDLNTIVVRLAEPKRARFDRFQCLMETLDGTTLEKDRVRVLVIGEEAR